MELSQRLRKVADRVPEGAVLADIGTDHGRLPVWLMEQGRISEAFACDVRPGPLSRARELILEQGLSDRIHPVLSDGMEALEPGKITAVTIAGMGGRLTARILLADLERKSGILCGLTDLILQPQSEWDVVRRAVHDCGFRIAGEEMVEEREQFYLIIHSCPGGERYEEAEYAWGRFLESGRDPVFRRFLLRQLEKTEALLEALSAENTEAARRRSRELTAEQQRQKEVLARWQ